MHLYSRAAGLASIDSRPAMDKLLQQLIDRAILYKQVNYVKTENIPEDGFYEAQIDQSLFEVGGITIIGLYNPETEEFKKNFYFPYVNSRKSKYNMELIVERKADNEAYLVHCNEPKREVTPIFSLKNTIEYKLNTPEKTVIEDKYVYLSAMAVSGKIILPVKKTAEQIEKCNANARERNQLVDKALQGDQAAIDSLTIGDYDTLTDICNRIHKEDIYSIVDSSFIPSGLECDKYSVIGNIENVETYKNEITNEEIYYMDLECNDIEFSLCINKKDLYGIPQTGYRYVGKIWLLGSIFYGDSTEI